MSDKQWRIRRLLALAAALILLFVAGKSTGLTNALSAERIRNFVGNAGPWGYALYAGLFACGELVHVPGMFFVGAGVLAFGKLAGFFAALTGSILSVCFTFLLVRTVAGRALSDVQSPMVKRMLSHLDEHPIRTVALLRLLLWLAPPVNYALALSNVRFRDYLVGSAFGLLVPVMSAALLFDWLIVRFDWLFR